MSEETISKKIKNLSDSEAKDYINNILNTYKENITPVKKQKKSYKEFLNEIHRNN
jgi:hypothetical protein